MDYRNPKYEQKLMEKWRTNNVSTKFVHFSVVSVRNIWLKLLNIWPFRFFVPFFFSRFFLQRFLFGRTKFTRSSSDKLVHGESAFLIPDALQCLPYYVRTYVPFGFVPLLLRVRACTHAAGAYISTKYKVVNRATSTLMSIVLKEVELLLSAITEHYPHLYSTPDLPPPCIHFPFTPQPRRYTRGQSQQ